MSDEQRKQVLQILYEERGDPLQTLDREELARRLGKPWHELEPDVAYLEEKGYVVTRRSQVRTRLFHLLSITPKGVTIGIQGVHASEIGDATMITILFLAADPTDASRLRLGEESREIQEKLQLAKLRDRFAFHQRMSVRSADVSQALLDLKPQIVHFSGHGSRTGEIYFEDSVGKAHPVSPEALAALFGEFTHQVKCVVLNACYTEPQANAITQHIRYVIGMKQAIGDRAAIAFTVGFYQAVGAGESFEKAFKLGCAQIGLQVQGFPEHLTPTLIKKRRTKR